MNNNDFYGNLDKIRKLYLKQNYDEAVRIADKMDFKRLKDWKYLAMLINLYEAVGRLEDVRYFCILAYNRNLGGKKLLYKLTKVYIRLDEIDDAEELYDEFVEVAGRDNKKYELLYELKAVQGAKKTELIKILEDFMKRDLDEKYAYTLAELYAKTKQNEKCVNFCERIIDRFEVGDAVEQAIALKNSILNPGMPVSTPVKPSPEMGNTVQLEEISLDTVSIPLTDIQSQVNAMQASGAVKTPAEPVMGSGTMVGQDTLGMNVEEIMAQSSQFDAMKKTANTQPISLKQQDESNRDFSSTQQFIPVNGYGDADDMQTQAPAADDAALMGDTRIVPSDIQEEGSLTAIEEQPVVPLDDEDLASLEANKLQAQAIEDSEQEAEINNEADNEDNNENNLDVNDSAVEQTNEPVSNYAGEMANESVDEPTLQEINISNTFSFEPVSQMTDNSISDTTGVDTNEINAVLSEATSSMADAVTPLTQDMESTMAMVEAALADETRAAQFEARMDMPGYQDEYDNVQDVESDKLVLRPFQPEIDAVYEIPMEVKRYFTKYNEVSGLENQIGEYFESTKHEDKKGTSGIGNIIISGNRSSDKTTLAINIVKALNVLYPENVRKIARTTGDNINQRGIERSIGKLLGAALIIEEAGVLDRQRIVELVEVMETNTQELLIILEDSESEINELLKNNPELLEKFNHRITYKQFTVNELVEMCKRYADKCKYTIDEKALLQLYLRIDEIHSSEDGVSLEDVRDVIDTAIEAAEKRANKKLFGGAKKKKIGNKDYTILLESDFK